MIKCNKCEKNMLDGTEVCIYCGEKIIKDADINNHNDFQCDTDVKTTKNKYLKLTVVAGVVAALFIVLLILIQNHLVEQQNIQIENDIESAKEYIKSYDFDNAIEAYEEILLKYPSNKQVYDEIIETYSEMVNVAYEQEGALKAIETLENIPQEYKEGLNVDEKIEYYTNVINSPTFEEIDLATVYVSIAHGSDILAHTLLDTNGDGKKELYIQTDAVAGRTTDESVSYSSIYVLAENNPKSLKSFTATGAAQSMHLAYDNKIFRFVVNNEWGSLSMSLDEYGVIEGSDINYYAKIQMKPNADNSGYYVEESYIGNVDVDEETFRNYENENIKTFEEVAKNEDLLNIETYGNTSEIMNDYVEYCDTNYADSYTYIDLDINNDGIEDKLMVFDRKNYTWYKNEIVLNGQDLSQEIMYRPEFQYVLALAKEDGVIFQSNVLKTNNSVQYEGRGELNIEYYNNQLYLTDSISWYVFEFTGLNNTIELPSMAHISSSNITEYYKKLSEDNPMEVEPYLQLSNYYAEQNDYNSALEVLENAYSITEDETILNRLNEVKNIIETTVIDIIGDWHHLVSGDNLSYSLEFFEDGTVSWKCGWFGSELFSIGTGTYKYEKGIVSIDIPQLYELSFGEDDKPLGYGLKCELSVEQRYNDLYLTYLSGDSINLSSYDTYFFYDNYETLYYLID